MDVPEPLIIGVVVLVVGSVAASFVDRLGAPTLLVFLGLGMLLGEDGPGGIHFNDAVLARDAGLVALAVILFEGGVLADLPEIRRVRGPAAWRSGWRRPRCCDGCRYRRRGWRRWSRWGWRWQATSASRWRAARAC